MNNLLIVESKNDQDFIEALVKDLNIEDTEVGSPICQIDDYECMDGLSLKKLTQKLESKEADIIKGNVSCIGVLIDQDKKTEKERLDFVSQAATEAFGQTIILQEVNTFYEIQLDEDTSFRLVCHFTNVDGQGELETVLKEIATEEAVFAECLEAWRVCIEQKGKKISQKEFDKFWISNYIRFDTCTRKEKKQAGRKCSMHKFDYILQEKNIFDLRHALLNDLRAFLKLFK